MKARTTLKDMVSDRVMTHDRKPGVTAKTVGQKKYLDAIRKSRRDLRHRPGGHGQNLSGRGDGALGVA